MLITTLEKDSFSLKQFKKAADNFDCAVGAFNAVKPCLKSSDGWKIKLHELCKTTYNFLWKSLLRVEKLDEALFTAVSEDERRL